MHIQLYFTSDKQKHLPFLKNITDVQQCMRCSTMYEMFHNVWDGYCASLVHLVLSAWIHPVLSASIHPVLSAWINPVLSAWIHPVSASEIFHTRQTDIHQICKVSVGFLFLQFVAYPPLNVGLVTRTPSEQCLRSASLWWHVDIVGVSAEILLFQWDWESWPRKKTSAVSPCRCQFMWMLISIYALMIT